MSRKIKINKHGDVEIQHFDAGGQVTTLGGPGSSTVNSNTNPDTGILGTINGALGLNNEFAAGAANTQAGTNASQLNQAYTGAQSGLTQQQSLVDALAAQNGMANQSSTFNQQQDLANALKNQAAGGGPNPAQAALNQNTGANVNTQAALMAGQRGSGSNAGLIARQAGQQGAGIQQQAVGQGATMQAQQQISAETALANQQAQMQGVAANEIAAQGQNTNVLSQAQQNEQNILQNANTSYNNAQVGMQENMNTTNAATSAANQNMAGNMFGGLMSMGSSAVSGISSMLAEGGEVQPAPNKKLAKVAKKDRMPLPAHLRGMAAIFHPKHYAEGGEVVDDTAEDKSASPESSGAGSDSVQSPNSDEPAASPSSYSGSFSPSPSSASNGPGGGAAVTLPAASTDFGKDMSMSSGGGSSGGGGGGGGMASLAMLAAAKGGMVPKMAQGGQMDFAGTFAPSSSSASNGPGGGAASALPGFTDAKWGQQKDKDKKPGDTESEGTAGDWEMGGGLAGGGSDSISNVQGTGDGSDTGFTMNAAKGGMAKSYQTGGKIPGKPKVNKDSYSNDTVKALLSPGEVVIPLHVMKSDDPAGNAAKFVAALMAKHQESQGNEADDFKSALKTAISSRKRKV